ncbi:hypothetical protein SAMN05443248_3918 [Bradyrhizobium erythrophlei]|jgi:hypothetical protein|uniref:Uncharacterized protein n=1 Tax=Bradyrhizobium erythrophlei TaxID=1437360 RepID=A0A1M5QQF3_9BRAD|nr:hypothetical protein SAMN05443248_3918 [Bradyrhizobium erythrophlei]
MPSRAIIRNSNVNSKPNSSLRMADVYLGIMIAPLLCVENAFPPRFPFD